MGCGDHAVSGFVAELTELLAPAQLALVFLDGDAGTALARAVARERRWWLQWYTGKLARYGLVPEAGDVAAADAYLEHEGALRLAAARRAGWSVIIVGRSTDVPPGQILRDAQQQLRNHSPMRGAAVGYETGFAPAADVVRVAVGWGSLRIGLTSQLRAAPQGVYHGERLSLSGWPAGRFGFGGASGRVRQDRSG